MISPRLMYQPVGTATVDAFHALITDPHIRRYLMDGQVVDRAWSEAKVRESAALFERRGVGLWLAYGAQSNAPVGFCGFLALDSAEPQLVYAVLEPFTGNGYATEMARASIAHARRQPGFAEIAAGVDAVNTASCRVLEKLGFERVSVAQGAFGQTLFLRLPSPVRAARPEDLEPLLALQRDFYAEDGYPFHDVRARAGWSRLLADAALGRVWAAEIDRAIVGYVVLAMSFSLEFGGPNAFVDELFVLEPHRGAGHGALLLDVALAACRDLGVHAVHLEVERKKTWTQEFYRRRGFADHDRYLLTKWLTT